MTKCPEATGFGVSLPVERGGHGYQLENHLRSRFTLFLSDLTRFQLGSENIPDSQLAKLPSKIRHGRNFDLIVLDGHHLRTNTEVEHCEIDHLLISQLLIALQSVRIGGTIVIKLSRFSVIRTVKIIHMLEFLSSKLSVVKPVTMHRTRGSFYAVAKGVGLGPRGQDIGKMVTHLQQLWVNLKYDVEINHDGTESNGRFIKPNDLDFIAMTETLRNDQEYLDHLVELGRDIWVIQAVALELQLKRSQSRRGT